MYFASLLGGLIKKHSRIAEAIILIVIWLLSAFASGNADSGVYEGRYNFYQNFAGMSEFGWQGLMILFNSLRVDYQTSRCILIAIELILLYLAVHRLTANPAFVLALYMVYPLCLDIVQMRFALAESIALLGMSFLFPLKEDASASKSHPKLLFVIAVILASLFHFIAILYLVLLLVPHLRTIGSLVVVPLVCLAFVVVINWSGLGGLASAVGLEAKYQSLGSTGLAQAGRYLINILLYLVIWAFAFAFAPHEQDLGKTTREALTVNWVIAGMVIPLLFWSVDFYRIQQGITLLNLCFFSQYLGPEKRLGFSKNNAAIVSLSLAIAFVNLYVYVLGNTNLEYVLMPMFENNLVLAG